MWHCQLSTLVVIRITLQKKSVQGHCSRALRTISYAPSLLPEVQWSVSKNEGRRQESLSFFSALSLLCLLSCVLVVPELCVRKLDKISPLG